MRESALLAAVAAVADSIRRHKLVGISRFGGKVGWMAIVSCVRVGLPVQTGYHKAECQIGTYVPILCRNLACLFLQAGLFSDEIIADNICQFSGLLME